MPLANRLLDALPASLADRRPRARARALALRPLLLGAGEDAPSSDGAAGVAGQPSAAPWSPYTPTTPLTPYAAPTPTPAGLPLPATGGALPSAPPPLATPTTPSTPPALPPPAYLAAVADAAEVPSCPISLAQAHEISPTQRYWASDGHLYCAPHLKLWLLTHDTSPCTLQPLRGDRERLGMQPATAATVAPWRSRAHRAFASPWTPRLSAGAMALGVTATWVSAWLAYYYQRLDEPWRANVAVGASVASLFFVLGCFAVNRRRPAALFGRRVPELAERARLRVLAAQRRQIMGEIRAENAAQDRRARQG